MATRSCITFSFYHGGGVFPSRHPPEGRREWQYPPQECQQKLSRGTESVFVSSVGFCGVRNSGPSELPWREIVFVWESCRGFVARTSGGFWGYPNGHVCCVFVFPNTPRVKIYILYRHRVRRRRINLSHLNVFSYTFDSGTSYCSKLLVANSPCRTGAPFRGHTTQILSSLLPKRDSRPRKDRTHFTVVTSIYLTFDTTRAGRFTEAASDYAVYHSKSTLANVHWGFLDT